MAAGCKFQERTNIGLGSSVNLVRFPVLSRRPLPDVRNTSFHPFPRSGSLRVNSIIGETVLSIIPIMIRLLQAGAASNPHWGP